MSVVAQQILSILQALGMELKRFMFEGREISLSKSVGIFITMNPGMFVYTCNVCVLCLCCVCVCVCCVCVLCVVCCVCVCVCVCVTVSE